MADKSKGPRGRGKSAQPDTKDTSPLTLSEVSARTGISMPTLQRYKKLYQSRIPSVGKGRTQRYPAESLAVFEALKTENIGRRGRPRKDSSSPAPEAAPARRGRKPGKTASTAKKERRSGGAAGGEGYLTLTAIADQTGISYPTLVRYSKVHANELPSRGSGRARRYAPEAVEVFRRLRGESPRGRRPKSAAPAPAPAPFRGVRLSRPESASGSGGGDAAVMARLQAIERAQAALDKQMRELVRLVSKPLRITLDRK